jgi:polysaccharide pyruvyl transferase WcaK-like protein
MRSAAIKTRAPSICLLGASFNTGNRGVAALAAGTVTAAVKGVPGAKIYLLDYAKDPSRHTVFLSSGPVEVELVNIRFSKKFWLQNNIARLLLTALILKVLPSGIRKPVIARNQALRTLDQADVVASIAGGDSFSDIYGSVRLLYVALPQLLVIFLGKPLLHLPQTFGPYVSGAAKAVARFIVRRSSFVYARDIDSLEEIRKLAQEETPKYKFSPDMAFVMEPCRPGSQFDRLIAELEGIRGLIGLNVSGLLYMGGYNRSNMFGLASDYKELTHRIIRHFTDKGLHVVLVPHVFGSDDESDQTANREIADLMRKECGSRLHVVEGELNQHEIKFLIGLCDFFLGARMHACIGALSQSIPAVGLAYSKKFVGVFRSADVPELVLDLRTINADQTLQKIDEIYTSRGDYQIRLKKRIPSVQTAVFDIFENFRDGGALEVVGCEPQTGCGKIASVATR